MYILCRNRERKCAAASEYIYLLLFKEFVAASENILCFFKERAAASEKYQCAAAPERKCAADIFCMCDCVQKHFNVFY